MKIRIAFRMLMVLVLSPLALLGGLRAEGLPSSAPADVGVSAEQLSRIGPLVRQSIEANELPGCVVLLARNGQQFFLEAYGNRQTQPTPVPMTIDTVFDMASITKPVATATSIMCLVEQGKVRLADPIALHIPEFANHDKQDITVYECLTHQAGFVPDTPLEEYDDPQLIWDKLYGTTLSYKPGSDFVYSDVGFQILGKVVERVSGESLDQFTASKIFRPLGMQQTGYLPGIELRSRCAPTEQRNGTWMQGEVHDPRAYAMGGVAGHAGLFSTATDLSRYAQMMLKDGSFDGARILSPAAVRIMTDAYPSGVYLRGLGWDKLSKYSSNRSDLYSPRAFGHGGFTGTVLWVDPDLDLIVIVLSNRVHPNGDGNVNRLAARISNVVVAAINDDHSKSDVGLVDRGYVRTFAANDRSSETDLRTGVDVLRDDSFRTLTGQKIGLITNHTGRSRDGMPTAKLLRDANEVDLVCLFSPEHGMAGKLDEPNIGDARDSQTNLPIYSLYGEHRAPSAEHLQNVDTLVFDIQDIGTRFYTYISTMGNAMRVAAEHGKRFVVLDRPNPIGGTIVDGPLLDNGRESFVGFHTLPIRHGMTVGELAGMFRSELKLDLQLDVIRLANWSRSMMWDETGLMWVNPSPNMRTPHQALLYPGIGLLESTNLSVGRGTDTPFELIGAPWIKACELARKLNQQRLGGVNIVPIEFTPDSSKYAGEPCQGIRFVINDRRQLHPIHLGLSVACAMRDLYRDQWQMDAFDRLLCDKQLLQLLKQGATAEQLQRAYQPELADFELRRASFLLYE